MAAYSPTVAVVVVASVASDREIPSPAMIDTPSAPTDWSTTVRCVAVSVTSANPAPPTVRWLAAVPVVLSLAPSKASVLLVSDATATAAPSETKPLKAPASPCTCSVAVRFAVTDSDPVPPRPFTTVAGPTRAVTFELTFTTATPTPIETRPMAAAPPSELLAIVCCASTATELAVMVPLSISAVVPAGTLPESGGAVPAIVLSLAGLVGVLAAAVLRAALAVSAWPWAKLPVAGPDTAMTWPACASLSLLASSMCVLSVTITT